MKKNLLDYQFPDELKRMSERDLELLSYEIRDFLIDKVSKKRRPSGLQSWCGGIDHRTSYGF